MKRFIGLTLVCLLATLAWAQFDPEAAFPKDKGPQLRTVTGNVVTRQNDAPISGAVVYLKNTRTLAVKSFITDDKGSFRFPALQFNVDYQLYAEFQGKHSDTKTLSSFDDRPNVSITLKVDTGK